MNGERAMMMRHCKEQEKEEMRIIQFVSREWRENEDKNGFQ